MLNKKQLVEYLIYLSLTLTGLKKEEIMKLVQLTDLQLQLLNLYLSPFITNFGNLFKLIDEDFLAYVRGIMRVDQRIYFFKKIGDSIDSSEINERNVKERLNSCFIAQDYFILKHILGSIEVFLVFFRTPNKIDLYKYWSVLISRSYDPVIEYIKSVETFEMHYELNPDDLFKLIVQMSIFFVDLAEFEEFFMPEFRRPKLRNILLSQNLTGAGKRIGPFGGGIDASAVQNSEAKETEKQESEMDTVSDSVRRTVFCDNFAYNFLELLCRKSAKAEYG